MTEEVITNDAVVQDAPVVEETTTQDSSPVEQTVDESSEDVATPDEPVEDAETNTSEDTESAESEDDLAMPEGLAPKSENRFQKLANRNRELEERVKQLEEFKVPTEQDYIDGGYDPMEAKVNAMQAEWQQSQALGKVKELNQDYETDMVRIIHEYPQLDPTNDLYNEKLAIGLFTQYDRDSGTQYADGGVVLTTNQLPHQYIKDKMDLIGIASANERVKAQKNVERMVSAADTQGSRAPAVSKDDSTEALRDRLADIKF